MKLYHTGDTVLYNKTVVALGEFDGLHSAHMELIRRGMEYAKAQGLPFGVMCFNRKLGASTGKGYSKMLIEPDMRNELLKECDYIYIQDFNDEFMNLSPLEFCRFLKDRLKAVAVFAGFNYRFGRGATGTTDILCEFEEFDTHIIEEQKRDGETVSSTVIRNLIAAGDMEKANSMLGRNYSLDGYVESGKQNGRMLGFPTANLRYNSEMAVPSAGVYAGYTYVDEKKYKSVINIGNNPTFDADEITIESHIIDFDGDIYEKHIRVEFIKKLRSDIKFRSLKELSEQIGKDKDYAIEIL